VAVSSILVAIRPKGLLAIAMSIQKKPAETPYARMRRIAGQSLLSARLIRDRFFCSAFHKVEAGGC